MAKHVYPVFFYNYERDPSEAVVLEAIYKREADASDHVQGSWLEHHGGRACTDGPACCSLLAHGWTTDGTYGCYYEEREVLKEYVA